MNRRQFILSLIAFCLAPKLPRLAWAAGADDVIILCYHDVGDPKKNPYSVTKEQLIRHFTMLKENGYHPISFPQYADALEGKATLPEKPVLLTFDDGYISFYNEIYPLLKQFQYPALFAFVTGWLQWGPPPGVGPLVDWAKIREMESSGLVSVASHTHNLHHYILVNPLYDTANTATSFEYRAGKYESLDAYLKRIQGDLQLSQQEFIKNLGHPAEAMVWPYGEYNEYMLAEAKAAGFRVFFTLGETVETPQKPLQSVQRSIIYNNPNEQSLRKQMAAFKKSGSLRVGQLDIDMLYTSLPAEFDKNIDMAVDQLLQSGVTTVFLQAFNDETGSGLLKDVYFYTTAAPVKADVFSHVVHRLKRAGLEVFAWMPTLSGQWLLKDHPEDEVLAVPAKNKGWYRRATPFSPRVRAALKALYRDLAAYSQIDGILFQDDLYLNDFEDHSPAARAAFKARFQRELDEQALQDPAIAREWATMKTTLLNDITKELAAEVQKYRPMARIARNIYAAPVLDPQAVTWLAQDYQEFLRMYDYTVLMAYPFLEKASQPVDWQRTLAKTALAYPGADRKVIFKLQSFNWATNRWIASKELAGQVTALKSQGAVHLGYYPINVYDPQENKLPF